MSESTFDFNQWLTEARVATRSVDILQRPDLIGEYEEWRRQYERAVAARPSVSERTLGEQDPVDVLEAQGRQLLAQIQAARTTWYLAALSDRTEKAVEAAYPLPESPVVFDLALPVMADSATEKQADAFLGAWEAWKIAQARFVDDNAEVLVPFQAEWEEAQRNRQAERLARSVTAIRAGGVLNKVRLTADQVLAMEATLGKAQVGKLLETLAHANDDDPEQAVPAAFLSRT